MSFPFDLMIVDDHQKVLFIDLEEPRWATTYADWMRRTGWWMLRRKDNSAVALIVRVNDGDQPYFTARHVGVTGSGGGNEVTAFGIGKKCKDDTMVRLWVMPDGTCVGGDDVDDLGILMVHSMGPR